MPQTAALCQSKTDKARGRRNDVTAIASPLSSSYGVGSHCRAVLHSLDQLQDATSAIGRTTRRLRSDVCVKSELGAAPSSEIQALSKFRSEAFQKRLHALEKTVGNIANIAAQ
eukprot:GHVT01005220.1.p2 GENE.GHVT01005220.1~~GHVT01005220.1.p2  ORF type:complete len:113 (+),score=13.58 GHVT01005220.1:2601-2939(+)